jgi:hypothetical protein
METLVVVVAAVLEATELALELLVEDLQLNLL